MREKLKNVPQKPGVYLFKDENAKIIYVGKAKVLRNRMRSYFQSSENLAPKVQALVSRVADFDFVVTESELEALLLENNLIKAYQPKYNILLRDDKTYPHLKVSIAEKYPRLTIVRGEKDGKSKYYGPYTETGTLRETVRYINNVFKLRTCKNMQRQKRACIYKDIGLCMAPCSGQVSQEEYYGKILEVIKILEGDHKELIQKKEIEMKEASAKMEFEQAARLRDEINYLDKIRVNQQISTQSNHYMDIIALSLGKKHHLALLFKIRKGNMVGKETIWLSGIIAESVGDYIGSFIQQFYDNNTDIPKEILLAELPNDSQLLAEWLKNQAGHKVDILVPQRGEKKKLMQMVQKNADLLIEEFLNDSSRNQQLLIKLSQYLDLEVVPQRMECYDISHLGSTETVAAMVVFNEGLPDKSSYRRFKISKDQNNDYAALVETLQRRFREARKGNEAFLPEPDLIVIDGGIGQLNSVNVALKEMEVSIPIISLAKKEELIFRPQTSQPLRLDRRDECLMLLQRLRDETHRFAITYNRKRRDQKTRNSALDDISGIGQSRKKELLKHFGSVAKIKDASLDDLLTVKGINESVAMEIIKYFSHKQEN